MRNIAYIDLQMFPLCPVINSNSIGEPFALSQANTAVKFYSLKMKCYLILTIQNKKHSEAEM